MNMQRNIQQNFSIKLCGFCLAGIQFRWRNRYTESLAWIAIRFSQKQWACILIRSVLNETHQHLCKRPHRSSATFDMRHTTTVIVVFAVVNFTGKPEELHDKKEYIAFFVRLCHQAVSRRHTTLLHFMPSSFARYLYRSTTTATMAKAAAFMKSSSSSGTEILVRRERERHCRHNANGGK